MATFFIKHFYLLFLVAALFLSCGRKSKYSKENHLYTSKVDSDIFSENFRVDSYGVGGDVYSLYITDSLKFRKFVTVYYDSEGFDFEVNGDVITVTKLEETVGLNKTKKVIRTYMYNKINLRERGINE